MCFRSAADRPALAAGLPVAPDVAAAGARRRRHVVARAVHSPHRPTQTDVSLAMPCQHRVPSSQRAPGAVVIESSPGNHLPVPDRGAVATLGPVVLMFVNLHE